MLFGTVGAVCVGGVRGREVDGCFTWDRMGWDGMGWEEGERFLDCLVSSAVEWNVM